MHEMFVALSVEDTRNFSVDLRRFRASLIATVPILTPSLWLSSCSLASQLKLVLMPVQVNSATALTETLTARGGMVISG